MSQPTRLRSFAGVLGAAAALALSGCYAETGAGARPAYVEASQAPANLEVCTRSFYEGRAVYFTNDRWYAHDRGHWVYYRNEPVELHQYRLSQQRAQLSPARVSSFAEPIEAPRASVQ